MTGLSLSAPSAGSPLWYATRATGIVALVLLTASVALGIAGTVKFAAPGLPRVVTAGLHRNVSLLVACLVAVHVLTTVLDSYVRISLVAAVVPFASDYRGFWLGLGTVAADLLLVLLLTSLLRDRMSYRLWRGVHWLGYACWPVALWHGLGTGTDSRVPWLIGLDVLCVAVVLAAAWWRLTLLRPGLHRTAAISGSAALTLGTAAFVVLGPLQPGWARRAGTPAALLSPAAAPGRSATAAPSWALAPSTAAFTGHVRQTTGPGAGEITITVQSRIATGRILTIVLRGTPADSGISMSSGTVRLAATSQGAWAGRVTTLDGHHLTAVLHGTSGSTREADLTLIIRGDNASGQLTLRPVGPS